MPCRNDGQCWQAARRLLWDWRCLRFVYFCFW